MPEDIAEDAEDAKAAAFADHEFTPKHRYPPWTAIVVPVMKLAASEARNAAAPARERFVGASRPRRRGSGYRRRSMLHRQRRRAAPSLPPRPPQLLAIPSAHSHYGMLRLFAPLSEGTDG